MKNRLRSPACVSARSRLLTRVIEWKPATTLACSRSITLMTDNSRNRCLSRSWMMSPLRLLPVMENCVSVADETRVSRGNFPFDMASSSRPPLTAAIVETGKGHVWVIDSWRAHLLPMVRSAFHYHVAPRKVLEKLGERFPPIECSSDLLGIGTRELEEYLCSNGEDCRTHLGRILIQELICRDDRDLS